MCSKDVVDKLPEVLEGNQVDEVENFGNVNLGFGVGGGTPTTGKVNSVVDVDDSTHVSASKDKGKSKVNLLDGFQDDDPPVSSHQGRGLF